MKILEGLNDQQRDAVFSKESKICVIAGPGCGKTRTLVAKVVHLISTKETNPEKIALLTFSKKAIREIRERIVDSIGYDYSFSLNIHNFHSFCYKFLRENFLLLGFDKDNFPIYDKNDQELIIKKILYDQDYSYDSKELNTIISIISLCKIKNGFANSLKERDFIKYEIFQEYQKALEVNKALDFNDLLIKTIYILKNNFQVKKKYQEKFTNILVDEFQDVNDIQWEIVNLLVGDNTKIFLVGDPNQSIYGFQGSSPDLISSFIDQKDWKVIYLNVNYRSTKDIIDLSNHFLNENNDSLINNQLQSVNGRGNYVEIINNSSVRFIVKKIIYLIEKRNIKLNEIIILYRSNYLSAIIEQELIFNNIPYEILGSFKFIEREEIKDIISYLKSISFQDNVSFLRVLKITESIGPKFIEKIEKYSQKENLTIIQFLFKNINEISEGKFNPGDDWKLNKNQKKSIIYLTKNLDKFSEILNEKINLSNFSLDLIKDFNYFDHLDKKVNSNEKKKNVQQFLNVIKNWEKTNNKFENLRDNLNDFIQYCLIAFEDNSMKKTRNNLILSSVHQAKGLEFEVVFFLYLDRNIIPYKNTLDIVEEKRIFYVGITRAKNMLYLVSNSSLPSEFVESVKINR